MSQFTDSTGRSWIVTFHVGNLRQIKSEFGIDLLSPEAFVRLGSDPVLLFDVLEFATRSQRERFGLSVDHMAESFDGETISASVDALVEALIDFFPQSRREVLRLSLNHLREAETAAMNKAADNLRRLPGNGSGERPES